MATFTLDGKQYPRPGYGAMGSSAFYGATDLEQSRATLRKAIEIGYTVWNTADMYGKGANEELIGSVLKDKALREKVFVITKWANKWGEGIEHFKVDGSPEYAAKAIDDSIKRLGFTPDAWIQHRIDKEVTESFRSLQSIEDSVAAMEKARKEGKTKYIVFLSALWCTVLGYNAPEGQQVAKIDFIEVEYSPWELVMEENNVLKTAKELGCIVLAYSPLGRGFLTGRYKSPSDFETGDFRTMLPRLQKEAFDENYKLVTELEKIAKRKGCTPGQLSLAWLIGQGDNIVPIPGTKSEKYLIENFASRDIKLSQEELTEIREIVQRHRPAQDRYMSMASIDTD